MAGGGLFMLRLFNAKDVWLILTFKHLDLNAWNLISAVPGHGIPRRNVYQR